ncbi:methylmalonyl-CoA mutase family protein [Streptomonospora sediminis]
METPESGPPTSYGQGVAGPAAAADFPEATFEQWRELVAGVLKKTGAAADPADPAPEAALAAATYDGIVLRPLYTAADTAGTADPGYPGLAPFTRGGRPEGAVAGGWEVRQQHRDPRPEHARRAVLADLENGVDTLWLVYGASGIPVGALGDVLADVHLDLAPVTLDPGADYPAAAAELPALWRDRGLPDTAVAGGLGIDPLTVAARTGEPADLAGAARTAAGLAARHPRLRLVTADSTPYHDAGGSPAQELGAAAGAGVAYLRALTGAGMDLADAARRIEFRFAAGADQFATIAKLRAARTMWNRVLEVCGLGAAERPAMRQHAVTSAAMATRRDPHVNMIRTTLACFAAGTGGADTVTVRPFDSALGLPDDFSLRIARNTQTLLAEESHLARVVDPAGGSFYVERLTADLHAAGWTFFQEIEAAGGMAAALSSGLVAARVDDMWQRRRHSISRGRDPITGVTEFPDLDEPPIRREPPPEPAAVPAAGSAALPPRRYAQDFEDLRDRSDTHLAATGARPQVFLATLGPVAAHTARAAFARNLLRSGGIETAGGDSAGGAADAVAGFRRSGARVACLCGSDSGYTEHAAAAAAALKEAGAETVLLAGRPETAPDDAQVDRFCFSGCDALGLLAELHEVLGVAR